MPVPSPGPDQVLVKVSATSVNLSDWECLLGSRCTAGSAGSGGRPAGCSAPTSPDVVEAVGSDVTRFSPGDEVYGDNLDLKGGFAEYALAPESALVHQARGADVRRGVDAAAGGCDRAAGDRSRRTGTAGADQRRGRRLGSVRDPARQAGRCARDRRRQRRQARVHAVARRRRRDRLHASRTTPAASRTTSCSTWSPTGRCSPIAGRWLAVAATTASAARHGRCCASPPWGSSSARSPVAGCGVLVVKLGPAAFEPFAERCVAGDVQIHIDRTFTLEETPQALAHVGEGRALGKVVVEVACSRRRSGRRPRRG